MSERASAARIFIVDDHPVVRQGLRLLFTQASHVVCGESESGKGVLKALATDKADVVVLDVSLGDAKESGLDLIEAIRASGCAVLVYSMHEDAQTIERALLAGASGYVSKRENEETLLHAVAELMAGRRHISRLAARNLAERSSSAARQEQMLSEREHTILTCLGLGDSTAEIARALSISVRTVETYCARLVTKLQLEGMRALRHYAIRRNLGQLGE